MVAVENLVAEVYYSHLLSFVFFEVAVDAQIAAAGMVVEFAVAVVEQLVVVGLEPVLVLVAVKHEKAGDVDI